MIKAPTEDSDKTKTNLVDLAKVFWKSCFDWKYSVT